MNHIQKDWLSRRQRYKARIINHMEVIQELRDFYKKELVILEQEIELLTPDEDKEANTDEGIRETRTEVSD